MGIASKTARCLLGSAVIAALGCGADGIPGAGDDPANEAVPGEDGASVAPEDGESAEVAQPLILPGESLIQATNGACIRAASKKKVTLTRKGCRPELVSQTPKQIPTQLAWLFEPDGRIRSAQFGNSCLTLPATLNGNISLEACSPVLDDLQVFHVYPAAGGWGKICSKVLVAPNVRFCFTQNGGKHVFTTLQSVAPVWYREDA